LSKLRESKSSGVDRALLLRLSLIETSVHVTAAAAAPVPTGTFDSAIVIYTK